MKIAIEALGIQNYGGGRTAALSLFEALFALDPENQYRVFLSKPEPTLTGTTGNVEQIIAPRLNRFAVRFWTQLKIPSLTRGFDLVHFTKNLAVFGLSTKSIITIHDLTTVFYPEIFNPIDVWYWKHILPLTLRQAEKIVAVSGTTATDIVSYYHLPAAKVAVIYNVLPAHIHPADPAEIQAMQAKYDLHKPYFLHVGRLDKKKNLTFLVEAFAKFRQRIDNDFDLVLVGEVYKQSPDENLLPTIERLGLSSSVRLLGRAPDSDLSPLNTAAAAVVYTSFHEGFGIAPIEAMACGTPVVCHLGGATQEVVADAALSFEKLDADLLADLLVRVIQDTALRTELQTRGRNRAAFFGGLSTARQLLDLYQSVVTDNVR